MFTSNSEAFARATAGARKVSAAKSLKSIQKGVRSVVANAEPLMRPRLHPTVRQALEKHGPKALDRTYVSDAARLLGWDEVERVALARLKPRDEAELETVTTLLPSWSGTFKELVRTSRGV
jgi:hypothetical protein